MQDSYPMWKELYLEALLESDTDNLTELVHAAEYAIVLRLQELENFTDHHEERVEMNRAAADLLGIKICKLGWPSCRPTSADNLSVASKDSAVALEYSSKRARATGRSMPHDSRLV